MNAWLWIGVAVAVVAASAALQTSGLAGRVRGARHRRSLRERRAEKLRENREEEGR